MWHLHDTVALLDARQFNGRVDVANPGQGVHALRTKFDDQAGDSTTEAALWRFAAHLDTADVVDFYVRGCDLVATYSPTESYPCRTQIYWRYVTDTDWFGLELIVSVHTPHLQCHPGMSISSVCPAPPTLLENSIAICPVAGTARCYVELAHPSNLAATSIHDRQIVRALFPGPLEKGVIRRARLQGLFIPTAEARESAARLHRRLIQLPPPLTT